MQRLQKLLQRAVSEKADLVDIVEGNSPTAWLETGQLTWGDAGAFSSQEIKDFFRFLFPAGIQGPAARGQIEIPNFGTLLTIGSEKPKNRLLIFLPNGHAMFEIAWADINNASGTTPTPPINVGEKVEHTDELSVGENQTLEPTAPTPPSAPAPLGNSSLKTPHPPPPPPPMHASSVSKTFQIMSPTPTPASVTSKSANQVQPPATPAHSTPIPTEAPSIQFGSDDDQMPSVPMDIHNGNFPPIQSSPGPQFEQAEEQMIRFNPEVSKDDPDPQEITEPVNSPSIPVESTSAPKKAAIVKGKLKTDISPGPKEFDQYLKLMISKKASDMHITCGQPMALRIDGEIERYSEYIWDETTISRLLDPITSEANLEQFVTDNDTDFAYEIPKVARFRINLFRDRHGRAAVIRQVPSEIPSFERLGLPEILKKFCYLNKGLVVITGPTGSGKSTTLAAMIDHINDIRKDHILTLEDPIEFVHPQKNCLIRQREIHKHTTTFARALRAALREDPDIIMVGELRDLETTSLAIEIAETGHLVFATLHTTTAPGTIDRIIDQFPADRQEQIRTMLAECLRGVVAQTLLKQVGGGRVAAQEILVVNTAVSALIREGKIFMLPNHMQSQKAEGNALLNESLLNLVKKGLVHPKEAWVKSVDKVNLIERYKQHGIELSWYYPSSSTQAS